MTDLKIENNSDSSRFEVLVNGKLARLDYRVEPGTIFLLHVEVPVEEERRGIASSLTKTALDFARDRGLKVVPRCPFVAAYMRKHPEVTR
jgi:hypothetical protein